MKKILFLTSTNNSIKNGNILCELHRLRNLTLIGEVSYLSLHSNKEKSINYLKDNNLYPIIRVIEPRFFWVIRLIFKINYIFNVIFCNKLKLYKNHYFIALNVYRKIYNDFDFIFSFYIFPSLSLNLFKVQNANFKLIVDTNDIMTSRHDFLGKRTWYSISRENELLMKNENIRVTTLSSQDENHYSLLLKKHIFKLYFNTMIHTIQDNNPPCHKSKIGILSSNSEMNRNDLCLLMNILTSDSIFNDILANFQIGGSITEYAKSIQEYAKYVFQEEESDKYIERFYDDLEILIVPNGKSSGIKTKILESLNYSVRVITTQFGYDESLSIFSEYIRIINFPIQRDELKNAIQYFQNKKLSESEALKLREKFIQYDNIIHQQFQIIFD